MKVHQTKEGWWVLDDDIYHTKWVEDTGRLDHDQYILPMVWPYVLPGSIAIDVGAHIGTHTICYLDAVGPQGAVLAFEPNKEAYDCLMRNCPLAVSYNWAVGDSPGDRLWVQNFDNAGASYMSPFDGSTHMTTLDREIVLVKGAIEDRPVSYIKIDTEGYELNVLRGAGDLITKYRPVIFMEYQQAGILRNGQTGELLNGWLRDNRYEVNFVPPDCNWDSEQCDLLCIPKEKKDVLSTLST